MKILSMALLAVMTAAATSSAHAQISGFSGYATTNGTAVNHGTSLTLTSNVGSEDGSTFDSSAQNISSGFDASFLYTVSGDKTADGLTFTLQNDPRGTSALGSGGGYLGYGGDGLIANSTAVEFNFNQSNSTGFDMNGGIGTPTNIVNSVSLASGTPVRVHLVYNGSTLTETLTQSTGTFSVLYDTGSLSSVLGGQTSYVGFTGADGGGASTQTISDFTFNTAPAVPETSSAVSLGLLVLLGIGGMAVAVRNKKATG